MEQRESQTTWAVKQPHKAIPTGTMNVLKMSELGRLTEKTHQIQIELFKAIEVSRGVGLETPR